MKESFVDALGQPDVRRVFAFGGHPDATAEQAHAVTTAYAGVDAQERINCDPVTNDCIGSGNTNHLRIIFDELLLGNALEEIECAGNVDDDDFQAIPVGATPDDIARCSVAPDLLPETCTGANALCICQNDSGCTVISMTSPTPLMFQKGQAIGVRDDNGDGAADFFRFVAGAVGIRCGSIDVPLDLDGHGTPADQLFTYYNPSGDQQVPATGGFEALGPAVILKPLGAMPTNLECGLTFSSAVVDKQNNAVCAPPGGQPADGSLAPDCSPGDVSAFTFKTEALALLPPDTLPDGSTGVSRTDPLPLKANVPVDAASIAGIVVVQGASTNYTQFTVAIDPMSASTIVITWTATGGLTANTMYTVTVPVTLHDTFMQPLPAPFVYHFTTGS